MCLPSVLVTPHPLDSPVRVVFALIPAVPPEILRGGTWGWQAGTRSTSVGSTDLNYYTTPHQMAPWWTSAVSKHMYMFQISLSAHKENLVRFAYSIIMKMIALWSSEWIWNGWALMQNAVILRLVRSHYKKENTVFSNKSRKNISQILKPDLVVCQSQTEVGVDEYPVECFSCSLSNINIFFLGSAEVIIPAGVITSQRPPALVFTLNSLQFMF